MVLVRGEISKTVVGVVSLWATNGVTVDRVWTFVFCCRALIVNSNFTSVLTNNLLRDNSFHIEELETQLLHFRTLWFKFVHPSNVRSP